MKAASAVVLFMLVGAGCATPSRETPAAEPGDPSGEIASVPPEPEVEAEEPQPSAVEEEEAPAAEALSVEDLAVHCVKLAEQAAQCPDDVAALLVQLRVESDPRFASVSQRPGVLESAQEKAKEAVLANGTGPLEARQERCEARAQSAQPVPATEPAELEACEALDDCAQKAACLRPLFERRMVLRPSAAPAR